jgi:ligand-binding sensor domain-containing protein/signal transduction histidine kinase/DNA-binding response OmpR family regulator
MKCCLRNKILILTAVAFSFFYRLNGQSYYFNHYQVENGLSNNSVECSLQDEDGFLWFGTINGLNRFDGYTFKTFHNNPEDSTSIGSNFIRCLYNDNHNTIWIGTNKGIYTYNKIGEKFSLVKSVPVGNSTEIISDPRGNYWFIIDLSVYRLNPETGEVKMYRLNELTPVATSIALTPGNDLWVSTTKGSLKKYNLEQDSFVTYSVYEKNANWLPISLQKIYPITDDSFLIGTKSDGVKLFDARSRGFKDILTSTKQKTGIYVREFIKRNDHEYWIGTETGIYIYNTAVGSIVHLQKEFDNPYSISDNVIFTFCKDREGGLWVGTYLGGINYLPTQYVSFQKFFPQFRSPSLNGNAVHEICKDQYGNFWVGTEDGGVNKINIQKNSFTSFSPTGLKGSIVYHNIHGLLATGNELWIGTFEHGMDVLNIPTGKVIRHYQAGPSEHDLKSNFIVTIYETKAHELLIGTWGGLFKYNRSTDNFSSMPEMGFPIQAILEDDQNILWCCTQGDGVYRYDPQNGTYASFKYDPASENSLIDNHVNGIFQDLQKNLWFATEGGLCKYEKDKKKFTRYSTKNGLPDNLIFRIMEDGKNNLWISTSKGLVCFNPELGSIKTFKQSYGLLSDQFNYNSSYKDTDGMMYFGSVKGLIGFNPSQFIRNTSIPPVYITGFQVNNKELSVDNADSPLKESITYTRHISLPYDQSTISIDFAALSYTVPDMNEYAYKMDGLDKDWTYLKTNRKAYFTKLPPGTYTFKVKGSNSSGVWNEKQANLEIYISPPLWESAWAYVLYSILIGGVAYLLIRFYVTRENEKNIRKIELLEIEKEREIYHAKIEFFTNVAHEIRTPLTLIKMPLEKLMKKENHHPEINENLRTMEKNTNRLIDLTNQLLDFRKTETDKFSLNFVKTDVSDLLRETFSVFQPAADQKNVHFKLEMPRIALLASVDPEALKKILSNLLNNAIKYADNKVIVQLLPFSSEDKVFIVEIKNDGYIIPHDQKEKIFEPFYRLKETEKQAGTGIGLPLSRALTESHKGVLDLKKPENNLNVFQLILPIHQDKEFNLQNDEPETPITPETTPMVESDHTSRPAILFVEDNKEIQDFICRELHAEYAVRKAQNGKEALDILKDENIQLVISDIMMPVMDGLELCRKIKTNLEYSHIPIILLTARNTLHSKIEGLEVGADAYIEKPFAFEHLHAQISNLLSNRSKIKEYFASSPLVHMKSIGYSKTDKHFLEQLDTIIHQNLTNMDIDVENLAKIMNMSRATFYRKIKVLSNLTPHELINIARLKKAAEFLAEGNYKVYEVASMVGYTLQSNFARDFHKQFGMTPTEYVNSRKPV